MVGLEGMIVYRVSLLSGCAFYDDCVAKKYDINYYYLSWRFFLSREGVLCVRFG